MLQSTVKKQSKYKRQESLGFQYLFIYFQTFAFNKESYGKAIFGYQLGNKKVTLLSGHLV